MDGCANYSLSIELNLQNKRGEETICDAVANVRLFVEDCISEIIGEETGKSMKSVLL